MAAVIRETGRFLSDWRNGATLVATFAVALLAYVVIDSAVARKEARTLAIESNRTAQAEIAAARDLQDRITELIESAKRAHEEKGRALAQAEALADQVRQLGAEPVITIETKEGEQ